MKTIILSILSATLLLATPAVVVEKEENPEVGKHAKITAAIEASIQKREVERIEKAKLREVKFQEIDKALKEKAIIRAKAA